MALSPIALIAAPGTGSARIAWLALRVFGTTSRQSNGGDCFGDADDLQDPCLELADAERTPADPPTIIAFTHPAVSCERAVGRNGLSWEDAELQWLDTYVEALRAVPADRQFLLSMDRVDQGDWTSVAALGDLIGARADDGLLDALRGYYLALVRKHDGAIEDMVALSRSSGELRLAWLLLNHEAHASRRSPDLVARLVALSAQYRARLAQRVAEEQEKSAASARAASALSSLRAAATARIAELDRLKESRWWRLRLGIRPRRDIANDLPGAFTQLVDDGVLFGLRPSRATLAMGRNLASRNYEEYALSPATDLHLSGLLVALSADLPHTTFVAGVELVTPSATIAGQFLSHEMSAGDLANPVHFPLDRLRIGAGERWRLRIFARDATGPIRAFELQRCSVVRRWRVERFAFVGFDLSPCGPTSPT